MTKMNPIPVFKPNYDNRELDALKGPFKSGWLGLGPKTKLFEEEFARYIGVKYAVAVNSCTAALHLALDVLKVTGRQVISTPMTFVSTNHAILYNGAEPVFADIYADTLNIDVEEIAKKITKKTKAIMTVHYGGHACDMDPILKLARKFNLYVVEDVAHGCGGEYKGRKLGSIGAMGCFSFHAVKNLAIGDGGMVTTNDKRAYEELKKLRWLGITKDTWSREGKYQKYSWYYDVDELGFKCHMNDISASLGLVQLKKLEGANEKRRKIFKQYNEAFKDVPEIETPVWKSYAKSACHNYVIKAIDRDGLNAFLSENGVSSSVHYYPNHLYKMYSGFYTRLPVTETVWKKLLTLPLYPDLTDSQLRKVIGTVKKFYGRK